MRHKGIIPYQTNNEHPVFCYPHAATKPTVSRVTTRSFQTMLASNSRRQIMHRADVRELRPILILKSDANRSGPGELVLSEERHAGTAGIKQRGDETRQGKMVNRFQISGRYKNLSHQYWSK